MASRARFGTRMMRRPLRPTNQHRIFLRCVDRPPAAGFMRAVFGVRPLYKKSSKSRRNIELFCTGQELIRHLNFGLKSQYLQTLRIWYYDFMCFPECKPAICMGIFTSHVVHRWPQVKHSRRRRILSSLVVSVLNTWSLLALQFGHFMS